MPPSKRLRAAALAELEQVLARGASMGASDVLLASGEPVFFRVLGQLSPIGPPVGGESVSGMVHAVLDDRHRAILEQRGSTTLASDVGTIGRVRISVSRHRGGLEGTFRVLRPRPSTPQELGLPHKLTECALGSGGLILIGGGPSSGRSSTLAALVAATTRGNAARGITFEDPVETLHETQGGLVSQREPGPSIAAAVRLALRADVDVVALGELSTREALEAAFEASEAGRRVLAVAAGTSIVRVLDRLIGLLPAEAEARGRAALASTVRAIFVQRLVRSADGAREHLAFELATGDPQLAVLIRDAKLFQLPSLMQRGQALGMVRFEDSLAELVRTGAVTLEAARGVSPDPRSLSEGENRPLRGAPGQGGPA